MIDRAEPKDLADVWGFCCRMDLSIGRELEDKVFTRRRTRANTA